ncbi:hypothetical protein ACV22V_08135 [Burkholderia sp. AW33-5]
MNEIKDGGPAFPCHTNPRPGTLNEAPQGMTLRDYFIAHAPAEPQPWFAPVLDNEPAAVEPLDRLTDEERREYEGWGEYLSTSELKCPRVLAYYEAVEAYEKLRRAWNREHEKQRYVQWPAAWADEMLRARGEA